MNDSFLIRWVSCLSLTALILGAAAPRAEAQRGAGRGVTRETFQGWTNALALESRDTPARAVVVPEAGGRVMFYGTAGDNLLWLDPTATATGQPGWSETFQPGGFQADIGPELAALPARPGLWHGPYSPILRRPHQITLRAPEDKTLGIELEKDVVFDQATGDLGFVHRLKNTADRDSAYCLWHRIALRPGGFVLLPVNPRSRFPAGWSVREMRGARVTYNGTTPAVPGVEVLDGVLVARTGEGSGTVQIGTDAQAQWAAYVIGRTLFVVHFPEYSTAVYSEGGNSVVVSWDNQRTELQPLSPEARLRSRRSYEFPMKWSLIELPAPVTTAAEARAVVERIPASPFL